MESSPKRAKKEEKKKEKKAGSKEQKATDDKEKPRTLFDLILAGLWLILVVLTG